MGLKGGADTDTIWDKASIRLAHACQLPWWWEVFGTKDPETILAGQGFDENQIRGLKASSLANAQMARQCAFVESAPAAG
ncbi:hypothetical protein [Cohnella silvisoli]|uniref:Uncharacterized protein n=1 Tax=Cohnella silvisoli TaxID=2873699 RepID=A0ABV1KMJ1_9BACL|nr:hypothetical protein [Cohnella silvisoli]MCD9020354.1 hypothetical protein [Cohnella silvisoli]